MFMKEQIQFTIKKCYFQIHNAKKIKKYVNEKNCEVLVNSLIIFRYDFCNALYYGLPNYLLH